MATTVVSKEDWIPFFQSAGFSPPEAEHFAAIFFAQKIRASLLPKLTHDLLQTNGIGALGDRMMILERCQVGLGAINGDFPAAAAAVFMQDDYTADLGSAPSAADEATVLVKMEVMQIDQPQMEVAAAQSLATSADFDKAGVKEEQQEVLLDGHGHPQNSVDTDWFHDPASDDSDEPVVVDCFFAARGGACATQETSGMRIKVQEDMEEDEDAPLPVRSGSTPVMDHEESDETDEEERASQPDGRGDASPEEHPELEDGEEAMEDDQEEADDEADQSETEVEVTPEARSRGTKRAAAATPKFAALKAEIAKKKSSARAKEEKGKVAAFETNSDNEKESSGSPRRTTRLAFAALPSPVRSPTGRPAPDVKKTGTDVGNIASSKKPREAPPSAKIVAIKPEKNEKELPMKGTKRPASSGISSLMRQHVAISETESSESVVKKSKRAEPPKEKQLPTVASTSRSGKRARLEEDSNSDEKCLEKSKGPGGIGAATGTEVGRIVTRNNRKEKEQEETGSLPELKAAITKKRRSKGVNAMPPGSTGFGHRNTRNKRERKEESEATIEEAKGASCSGAMPRPEDELTPLCITMRNVLEALPTLLGQKPQKVSPQSSQRATKRKSTDASVARRGSVDELPLSARKNKGFSPMAATAVAPSSKTPNVAPTAFHKGLNRSYASVNSASTSSGVSAMPFHPGHAAANANVGPSTSTSPRNGAGGMNHSWPKNDRKSAKGGRPGNR